MPLGHHPERGGRRGASAEHGLRAAAPGLYVHRSRRVLHAGGAGVGARRGVGFDLRGRLREHLRGAGARASAGAIAVPGRRRDGQAADMNSASITLSRRPAVRRGPQPAVGNTGSGRPGPSLGRTRSRRSLSEVERRGSLSTSWYPDAPRAPRDPRPHRCRRGRPVECISAPSARRRRGRPRPAGRLCRLLGARALSRAWPNRRRLHRCCRRTAAGQLAWEGAGAAFAWGCTVTASTPSRPSTGPAATARAFGDRLDLARQADAMVARSIPIRFVARAAVEALVARLKAEGFGHGG